MQKENNMRIEHIAENKVFVHKKSMLSGRVNSMVLPTDDSEATGIKISTGKENSSSTFKIWTPTNPVAPTTANFILLRF